MVWFLFSKSSWILEIVCVCVCVGSEKHFDPTFYPWLKKWCHDYFYISSTEVRGGAWGNIFRWSNWRALRKPPLFSRGREKKFRLWCLCADYNTHYTKYNWENTTEQSLKTNWQTREQETCVLKTTYFILFFC